MNTLQINKTSYCELREIEHLCEIESFMEQRDIEKSRIPPIIKQMETMF